MKQLLLFFAIMIALRVQGQHQDSLRVQLEKLHISSTVLRNQVMPTWQTFGMQSPQMDSLNEQIRQFDSLSLLFVGMLIDQHGWLGISEVGERANQTLFLTIQHAADPAIRKRYFPLLVASCERKESKPWMMATMLDRMQVEAGQLQIYGTQSHMIENELVPFPMMDPSNVNKRRKKVGLDKLKY